MGFRSFCGRGSDRGKLFLFVDLARLNFCVEIVLSGSPVGLSQFFLAAQGEVFF